MAIKALPEDFATAQDRLARFEREAKLLASLSHANIATICGLEDEGERRFIVMEVVEGETLAGRIAKSGRIDVGEARVSRGAPIEVCRQSMLYPSASWGPDDTIVFGHFSLGLAVVSASGGKIDVLTSPNVADGEVRHSRSEEDPALSPDGRFVAFAWDGGDHASSFDLYVQQIGSGDPLRLTEVEGDVATPTWSPDGGEGGRCRQMARHPGAHRRARPRRI